MSSLDLLKQAIEAQKPISYEYVLEGKVEGRRYGNPHAIFISTKGNINIDIFKTGGVRTDKTIALPRWQQYKVAHIENVEIENDEVFEIAEGYNPYSNKYDKTIMKI